MDSFRYTLVNEGGQSTATVTLDVTKSAWFVKAGGPNGVGSQADPFDNLSDSFSSALAGDTVFVFRGDETPLAGGLTLPAGVSLIGRPVDWF